MTATLLPNAKQQFLDGNGKPLAGGSCYFYIPNTSTPKSTWQDSARTILNTNPVILDASGEAIIWGTGTYRQVVYDVLGNLIWDQITQDTSAGITGDFTDDIFVAGTDFTPGTTTSLALSTDPGSITNTWIFFDAAYQADDQIQSLVFPTLTFKTPIPVGVQEVTVKIGTTVAIGTPGAGTVNDASLMVGSKVYNRVNDILDVKDYGAVGNGINDDTGPINTAFAASVSTGKGVFFPAGSYKITSPLVINGNVSAYGDNARTTKLVASGNFDEILHFGASSAGCQFGNLSFDITGTTTKCLIFDQGAQVHTFTQCLFTGDLTGDLIYSQAGGYITYNDCTWNCNGASTNGIRLDGFNQNTEFNAGHAGGIGTFLFIANSTGNIANNVQGTKCNQFTSICTGAAAIQIGGSAFANFFNQCIIDQAGQNCIVIEDGSSVTQINGGYYGLAASAPGTAVPILLTANAGTGNQINGAQTFGGGSSIQVIATASQRVSDLQISNCVFMGATGSTVQLDSVANTVVTGNIDLSNPAFGSFSTSGTFGAGSYTFDNNAWSNNPIANFHVGSFYKFGNDRGAVGKNSGAVSNGVATSAFTVNHGCLTTPTRVSLTPFGNSGSFWASLFTPTQFQINWTSGTTVPAWSWEADCSR